jgi:uncharacterized protein
MDRRSFIAAAGVAPLAAAFASPTLSNAAPNAGGAAPVETGVPKPGARECARALTKGFADQNLAPVYNDDAVIWHNFTDKTVSKAESLAIVAGFFKGFADAGYSRPYYVNIRLIYTDKGFVQQHVVEARKADQIFHMPGCLIIEVRDGRIARQDEYVDATPFLKLTGAV